MHLSPTWRPQPLARSCFLTKHRERCVWDLTVQHHTVSSSSVPSQPLCHTSFLCSCLFTAARSASPFGTFLCTREFMTCMASSFQFLCVASVSGEPCMSPSFEQQLTDHVIARSGVLETAASTSDGCPAKLVLPQGVDRAGISTWLQLADSGASDAKHSSILRMCAEDMLKGLRVRAQAVRIALLPSSTQLHSIAVTAHL